MDYHLCFLLCGGPIILFLLHFYEIYLCVSLQFSSLLNVIFKGVIIIITPCKAF
ncbi:uncharacterized protein DS421_15g491090 [Arachis hypogaea]|nr:uncharacterized protein DS421_15g491090 [Arachis hypogaea]